VTLAQVRLTLAEEDKKRVEEGRSTSHNVSPSVFLSLGMNIQELQYVLVLLPVLHSFTDTLLLFPGSLCAGRLKV
jgi:hypothetical protein